VRLARIAPSQFALKSAVDGAANSPPARGSAQEVAPSWGHEFITRSSIEAGLSRQPAATAQRVGLDAR
jgi:hypothetical protein